MRLLVFLAVVLIAISLPFPIFILAAALYVLRYTGYELLVVALLIDAQFGGTTLLTGYSYTLCVGALLVCATLLKPFFKVYTEI